MGDARIKLINKHRTEIKDARDRLAKIAKKTDARDKIKKIRNLKQGKVKTKKEREKLGSSFGVHFVLFFSLMLRRPLKAASQSPRPQRETFS